MKRRSSPGVAFGDYISTGSPSIRRGGYEKQYTMREFILPAILIVVLSVLFFRLVAIQLVHGSYYRALSDKNRIKTETIHASRGVIFDRYGTPLVFNVPGFRESVDGKTTQISQKKAVELLSHGATGLEIDSLRQYPYREEFGHVIGYVSQISKDELRSPEFSAYRGGDVIGKMGIEQEYEKKLIGTDGKKLQEVNSMGNPVRTLGQSDPIPGVDITLTLDAKLQHAAFEATKGIKQGVVIVSKLNGEVLVMLSRPSFDPNLFTLDETYEVASNAAYTELSQVLLDGDRQPLLDRAISGTYPPGSTFKLVTAAAGLENHIIDKNYEIQDTGIIYLGAFSFSNWFFTQHGRTDGVVDVIKAIQRSNDIFFYKLAELVGVETLSKVAQKFGVGSRLGIDLPGEKAGVLPTNEWKQKNVGEPWYLGDTYHYGIGQGYLLTTPLQVNAWTQAIANQGKLYRPRLLKDDKSVVLSDTLLDSKNMELIRQGMIGACIPGGVAWPFFDYKVKNPKLKIDGKNITEVPQATTSADFSEYRHVTVACKTGTAQHGGEQTLPHAWITLFAPAYNPEIVVTVLVESAGEGSSVAAPIAKKVLDEYFSR